MNTFETNVIAIYGDLGKAWLSDLKNQVDALSVTWGLSQLKPADDLSHHYVLSGFRESQPIILKLGPDINGLEQEAAALKSFSGFGSVGVLAKDQGALLLERAVPGTPLRSYFPSRDSEATEIVCGVIKKLHQASPPEKGTFPHSRDWLLALDQNLDIPAPLLERARTLRDRLLETSSPDILLHGDLHHGNILQDKNGWVVIDPKGVMGDPAYEVAAFIRNPIPELLDSENYPRIIENRIKIFSRRLGFDEERIQDWCFVQNVLAWAWCLEDGVTAFQYTDLSRLSLC